MSSPHHLPYYSSSVQFQRGRGFGGFLRGLFRTVIPLFKKPVVRKGLKSIGKAAASAVLEASHKALQDGNINAFGPALKEATKKRAKLAVKKMTGGRQNQFSVKGDVLKKGRKRVSSSSRRQKSKSKRKRGDIFSEYY